MTDPTVQSMLALADRLEAVHGPPGPDPSLALLSQDHDHLIHQLVYSMLLWEASHQLARAGIESVRRHVSDLNELRVCSALEAAAMLPRPGARRREQADRLVAALNDIYRIEHAVTLARLSYVPVQEARAYLDAIPALPRFVTARVLLIGLGAHAFPADSRIHAALRAHAVRTDPHAPDDAQTALERAVSPPDAPRLYALLETCAASARPARAKTPATAPPPDDQPDDHPDAEYPPDPDNENDP